MIVREVTVGPCRLIQGDCLEVIASIDGFDSVMMDPPYGIDWSIRENTGRNCKAKSGIIGDKDTSARDAACRLIGEVPAVVFGSFYTPFPEGVRQVCIWKKAADAGVVGSVTGCRRDTEPIFLIGKWPRRRVERSSCFESTRGQSATVKETGHPHTKPIGVITELVRFGNGNLILDPFMGSGTTGVACIDLGKLFVGIEKDPKWFECAVSRIEKAWKVKRSSLL